MTELVKFQQMPDGRSCRYTLAQFGNLNRSESMNVAVLVWEHGVGPDTPVLLKIIDDWGPIVRAFPESGADGWAREEVILRLSGIKTFGDYERLCEKMGPYTPFEFRTPYPSIAFPEATLHSMADYFLAPYGRSPSYRD
jgi:hypothetical protein